MGNQNPTTEKQSSRKSVDWDAIEPDWRAGIKTKKQMSAEYGVSRAAMDKHFGKVGIERELMVAARREFGGKVVLTPAQDEFDTSGFVYVIYIDSPERYYKIGMSKHFSSRFSSHQCASPFEVCVACAFFVPNMRMAERQLHAEFAEKRIRGEWFCLNDSDLREIASRSLLV